MTIVWIWNKTLSTSFYKFKELPGIGLIREHSQIRTGSTIYCQYPLSYTPLSQTGRLQFGWFCRSAIFLEEGCSLPKSKGNLDFGAQTPKELYLNIGGIHRREDWYLFPLCMSCWSLNWLKQSCATWTKEKRIEDRQCGGELSGGQRLGWACRFSVSEVGVMLGLAYVSLCKVCLRGKGGSGAPSGRDH